MAKGCKICHALTLELDSTGRCASCAAVLEAQTRKVSYGNLMAAKHRQEPEKPIRVRESVELEFEELPAIRPCACCGKLFQPSNLRCKYCGPECRNVVKQEQAKESARKKKGQIVPRYCPVCGKEFPQEMDIRQIACPGECTRLYRKRKTIERLAAKERERENG